MATETMTTAAEELEETGTHTEGIAEDYALDGEGDQGTPTDGDAAADEDEAEDAGDGFTLAQPYPVPSEGAFKGMDFLLDAGLATIARDLIDRHADDFWYLRGASIEWAWKRRGGGMNGKVQHHGHQRSSPHAVSHGAKEFIVWIAADASRGTAVTVDLLEAMLGHEFCVPGDTEVLGAHIEAASARWYAGEMVEIRTAAGNFLSGTPNHPVLTQRGWCPLGLVQKGDYVLSSADPQRVLHAIDPYEDHVPARIEQISRSGLVPLRRMPSPAEHFDPDISDRQVDVVDTYRALLGGPMAEAGQHVAQIALGGRDGGLATLPREREFDLGFLGVRASGPRGMRGDGVRTPLLRSHPLHADALGIAACARFDAECAEMGDHTPGARLGALRDGKGGLAGLVAFDKIRDVQRRQYAGHVYNLQTGLEWYVANGIITHNCHFRKNDDGELKITGHSFEGFPLEVRLFGLWQHELQNAARAFLGRSGEIEDEDAGDEESFLDALAMQDEDDEPDVSTSADDGIDDTPVYHPAQDAEDLKELASTLDAHPEEIEPLIAAAGPGPNVVTETAKRARGRRKPAAEGEGA